MSSAISVRIGKTAGVDVSIPPLMMTISNLSGIGMISNEWKSCLRRAWRSYVPREDLVTPKWTTSQQPLSKTYASIK